MSIPCVTQTGGGRSTSAQRFRSVNTTTAPPQSQSDRTYERTNNAHPLVTGSRSIPFGVRLAVGSFWTKEKHHVFLIKISVIDENSITLQAKALETARGVKRTCCKISFRDHEHDLSKRSKC